MRTINQIMNDKFELNKIEEELNKKKNALIEEYKNHCLQFIDEIQLRLVDFGVKGVGYINYAAGPFNCSTIYKFNTKNKKIHVFYNTLQRNDEFGILFGVSSKENKKSYLYYTDKGFPKVINFKENDCFLIEDMNKKEYISCSDFDELKKILEERI